MSSTPFGEHLKRERELRGVSLDEIAAATKINTRFLEALENGRWGELPGGAFNRGFVRSTSRFLGLDEDDMVAEFSMETGAEAQTKALAEPSGAMPRDFRPVIIAAFFVLVALIIGGWFTHHEIAVHRHKRELANASTPLTAPASSTQEQPSPTPLNSPPLDASKAADTDPPESTSSTSSVPAAGTNSPAPAVGAIVPVKPDKLELKIVASKTAEVHVVGDGKTLFKGRIHSEGSKHFEARDGFEVTSNDSSAVQLELNGQGVSLEGKPGKRGSVSLSRKSLKTPAE